MTSDIYISLGSNYGDRHAMIGKAVAALHDAFAVTAVSFQTATPVTSEPQGFVSRNMFVNSGVRISIGRKNSWTATELENLLDITQAIERSLSPIPHRNPDGSYRDREIDIDIIAVDSIEYTSPRLTIPHPAMQHRPFVLVPMMQLMPRWHHPRLNLTPAEMLRAILIS